jgi:hypothetical protein
MEANHLIITDKTKTDAEHKSSKSLQENMTVVAATNIRGSDQKLIFRAR